MFVEIEIEIENLWIVLTKSLWDFNELVEKQFLR